MGIKERLEDLSLLKYCVKVGMEEIKEEVDFSDNPDFFLMYQEDVDKLNNWFIQIDNKIKQLKEEKEKIEKKLEKELGVKVL